MPYGISWPRYLSFMAASLLSMMCGAQVVHMIYRPLDDLDDLVEEAIKQKRAEK